MRRALVLAYYFPPQGGAGVQRTLKFVQYLPELGYEPVVVTGPEAAGAEWAPPDASLAAEVKAGTPVFRAGGPEPRRRRGWPARATRWLRLRPPFSRWWVEGAVEAGRRAAAEHEIDVIYASMSPFETAEAAARLSRELGKPWVADLRDPWALDDWLVYPTRIHRRLELRRMRKALAPADAVIMNTPEATAQVLRHFPELRAVHTIPNGFDGADFDGAVPQRDDSAFRVVHAGFVHVRGGKGHRPTMAVRELLGGAVRGLDAGTRSHVYLLQAVQRLLERRPDLRGRVEVHLAGIVSDADRAVPGFELVTAHGYLPHDETVALLRTADLLFLPMHDLPEGRRARIVPGKTYEYLAARSPILAAVPDGDVRDLLDEAGNAFVVRPKDVEGMARVIEQQADGAARPATNEELLARYERRELTRRLVAVLDSV
ncbi:MAG TPA: glycosyltransferase family 4 protein [Gaiellaceae bacterium]